jgi:hypothetical protein
VVVFFALVPDRLPRLATALAAGAGCVVVMVALLQRAGVRDALNGPAPAGQRHSMLLVLVLACVAVALLQLGITLLVRHGTRPRWLTVSRRDARIVAGVALGTVAVAVVVLIVAGVDHRLWTQFKEPNPPSGNQYLRLLSIGGSHRYQYWNAATSAFDSQPFHGIGPGTFEFYWAQHNSLSEFVRNAHSLYIETMADLGIVGLLLIAGLVVFVLVAGGVRALQGEPQARLPVAAAVAGFAAFAAAAAFDWVWQIGVIPIIALLLAAVALGSYAEGDRIGARMRTRVVLGLSAIPALWAIAVPVAMTIALRSSQSETVHKNYRSALSDAATAQRLEPGAASPRLQKALILEQLGDISGASRAISEAEAQESTNWRIWLVASRIATESGDARLALADYRHAKLLNPTSPIFQ